VAIMSSVLTPANGFGPLDGTSMAAPHVTGAWALLRHRAPSASVAQVLSALTTTGQPVTDGGNGLTKPRIRVDAAANALAPTPTGTLTVTTTGTGTVTSSPSGITCGADCSETYTVGTSAMLTATTGAGQSFSHWSGICKGTETACAVSVDGNVTATANFVTCSPRPPGQVSVTKNGDGRLRLVVTAGAGTLRSVQLNVSQNGSLDIVGGQTNVTGSLLHVPTPTTAQATYLLRPPGGGGATVQLVVTDACGEWRTFGGGGASAF
jgi:hypothetical protein